MRQGWVSTTRGQVYVNRKFIARLKHRENPPRGISQTEYLKVNHFLLLLGACGNN